MSMLHSLKFSLFHLIGLFTAAVMLAGGAWIAAGFLGLIAFYVLGDALGGDDLSTPHHAHPRLLTLQLWLALPLLSLIMLCALWSVSPGDPLGIGARLGRLTGHDLLAAKAATTSAQHLAAFAMTGLAIGMIGTIPGHELIHRMKDPASMLIGRWLLAFSFDTNFSIEHVHGHHRYVSTEQDPATAPRGRSVYAHILISTWRGHRSAWQLECAHLERNGRTRWSLHNKVFTGAAMSGLLLLGAWLLGGLPALGFFIACGLWGKALLEIVNYMEHYGLVRAERSPVQPRHSWNTTRRLSSWTLFNLTRHSHHHAQGFIPYQDLRPYPEAPMMISGYLSTIGLTLIPPLWHHLMTPRLLDWDRRHATDEERRLAAAANRRSGLPALQASGAG